ncbi:hypothetical protein MBLNU459_g1599t1 [Dothideomycetes sp. NU459]
MSSYDKIPSKAKAQPKPFKASIPEETVSEFQQLLKLSKVGPAVYENQQQDRRFGTTRDWLVNAKKHWETSYDWRKTENHINSFPNFTHVVKDDDGFEFNVHFVALFSQREDAIPIAFYHGWPGSFLEFLPMMNVIRKQYSAADLPYHIIAPSLPGYAFSSGPPTDKDFNMTDMPRIMHKLMMDLGFAGGYIAQGGDLGSMVARVSAVQYSECKAFHLNMNFLRAPDNAKELPVDEIEQKALPRGKAFGETGNAYAREHGTRTATIGLVLSSSPLAMLAWIGEKFLEWSDTDPSLDEILDSVTLYYLTETHSDPNENIPASPSSPKFNAGAKPMGFSWFPKELSPVPRSWIEQGGNLVHFKQHTSGGHFAAMEKPEVLWADVEEFVGVAWKK